MKLAFVLFKYFPYGGLQRDFLRIANVCQERGHSVRVYTMGWQGECPADFDVRILGVKALAAHKRNESFHRQVMRSLAEEPVDAVVGFNKMAGLDLYYAADPCYEEKAQTLRSAIYRLGARYRHFFEAEKAVFSATSKTEVLMISELQKPFFQQHYGTQEERFHLLPPGIARDRCAPADADRIRAEFRTEFQLSDKDRLLLMVGSGFKTKGLDRALYAMASLPETLRQRTRFMVIGQDNFTPFVRLARRLKLDGQVTFMPGRDDIPRFMLGADLLVHPAYNENTGTVLLEAVVSGLPVLVTDVCGYAHYVEKAGAGQLLESPFEQADMGQKLETMLTSPQRDNWKRNALRFSEQADIFSMPERAAEIIERVGGCQ
ncbi:glycosyltransferase family 4 protein [Aestuariirhabdus sp. Z084]|uniref:glycosyltransferase family 4 protein n=1 Tax=Aestuariirhabdus haliotis TaxID=2918751 RepID=UPI00201B4627|nr:glycosyltransferase family 4 protein [Aestuariirhabdus haliotis]MCL6415590.1 glycosyltransferase family 4 protein [Aestuariirhabdus haliotis]MCL6419585.1 glycosyltransferase family 4 protein [Aestuariirhabdus haliotis]